MEKIGEATTGSPHIKQEFPACSFLDRGTVMTEIELTWVQANGAIFKKKGTVVTLTELSPQEWVSTETLGCS